MASTAEPELGTAQPQLVSYFSGLKSSLDIFSKIQEVSALIFDKQRAKAQFTLLGGHRLNMVKIIEICCMLCLFR